MKWFGSLNAVSRYTQLPVEDVDNLGSVACQVSHLELESQFCNKIVHLVYIM